MAYVGNLETMVDMNMLVSSKRNNTTKNIQTIYAYTNEDGVIPCGTPYPYYPIGTFNFLLNNTYSGIGSSVSYRDDFISSYKWNSIAYIRYLNDGFRAEINYLRSNNKFQLIVNNPNSGDSKYDAFVMHKPIKTLNRKEDYTVRARINITGTESNVNVVLKEISFCNLWEDDITKEVVIGNQKKFEIPVPFDGYLYFNNEGGMTEGVVHDFAVGIDGFIGNGKNFTLQISEVVLVGGNLEEIEGNVSNSVSDLGSTAEGLVWQDIKTNYADYNVRETEATLMKEGYVYEGRLPIEINNATKERLKEIKFR